MSVSRSTPDRRPPGGPRSPIARRIRRVFGLTTVVFVGLSARLAYLQIYNHDHFKEAAASIRESEKDLPALRGGLTDRNLTYLVHNEPAFRLTVDPNMWYTRDKANSPLGTPDQRRAYCMAALQREVPGVVAEIVREPFTSKLKVNKKGKIERHFQPRDFLRIPADVGERLKELAAPGLKLVPMSRRVIVDGTIAPQIVGVTNREGVGSMGLESSLNGRLAGKPGKLVALIENGRGMTANRIPLTTVKDIPAEDGDDYVLTLDAAIQKNTQQALAQACAAHGAEAGTAVVLDPVTGEILAMASWPTLDLNRFKEASKSAIRNQAIQSPDEPGSTLKAITVAAAMEEGLVTSRTEFFCKGAVPIGTHVIHCASHGGKKAGHGNETLTDVIRNSCNVATADCALRLEGRRLTDYLKKFGFTRTTGAGLPGESAGQLSSFTDWSKIKLANVGFGQGISVTSLQMAAAYGAFATGEYHAPRIVRGTMNPNVRQLRPAVRPEPLRVISPQTARTMRAMLGTVVERGTGRLARLHGYTSGGKTGTAQVAEHGGYGKKYVASFVGLAPLNDPKVVVLVSIRDPKGKHHFGGDVAAPAFRAIAENALRELHVPQDRPEPLASPMPAQKGQGFAEQYDL